MPPHLSWPQRVSRLYPIFSLILAITSSIFFYAWQSAQIDLKGLADVNLRDQNLHAQVDTLTAERQADQAQLKLQTQKVTDATNQLNAIQKQLQDSSDQLTTKTAQLKTAQDQLAAQQSQLTSNAAEIQKLAARPPLFSFANQSTQPNVTQEEADVKAYMSTAYDYMVQMYGQPYLLHSIIITFVDTLSIPGASAETIITIGPDGYSVNIHLKSFDKNNLEDLENLVHESLHGFHGAAVFDSSALEEGMVVAATDAITQKMMDDGKIPHFSHLYLTTTPDQYDTWNQTLTVLADNKAFYASPEVAEVYQLVGTAWFRLYQQDPNFFKKLNAAYYPKVQRGLPADTPTILDAIRSIVPTVNGASIDTYLAANRAFNPS